MNAAYSQWIAENVEGTGYGQCAEVTERMAAAFPELSRVRGHYYCSIWGQRGHWWLVGPNGEIVDPTAAQFPSKGAGVYVEWQEGAAEPTGMCPECGEYVFDGKAFCDVNCEISYMTYLRTGVL